MSRSNAASLSTTKRKTSVERELNPKKPRLNDSVRNASTIQVQGKASTEQGVDVLSGSIVQAADTPVVIPDEEHKHTNGKEPKNLQVVSDALLEAFKSQDDCIIVKLSRALILTPFAGSGSSRHPRHWKRPIRGH